MSTRLDRLSRRRVLAWLAASGAGAALAPRRSWSQENSPAAGGVIDVHHHIYPPHYTRANLARLLADAPLDPASTYLNWTPEQTIDEMDRNGVAAAVTSITSPGIWFGNNADGRHWARECNEYGARLASDHPGRFGMFAAIPLPDTSGSLHEIAYALDILKLDGIGLLTNYNGRYLGDAAFAPVFDELNRRQAVVFVHPILTSCCRTPPRPSAGQLGAAPAVNQPLDKLRPWAGPTDTTITITSLLYSGTLARCPDIRFIFAHGGGTLPMVINRINGNAAHGFTPERRAEIMPHGLTFEVQKLYFDIAGVINNPAALAADWKMAPMSQFMFGSDHPFGPLTQTSLLEKLDLPADALAVLRRDNALRLFPRFNV
jgi:predicted TIM-barrel fold metal-dependent hydrolase